MNLVAFTPPDWLLLADCQYTDPEIFFPEPGGSVREAKRVCRACDVRAQCLEYALENDERFGVWGGLSERERRKLKPTAPAPTARCRSGRHLKTPENTDRQNRCLGCRREWAAARYAATRRNMRELAA